MKGFYLACRSNWKKDDACNSSLKGLAVDSLTFFEDNIAQSSWASDVGSREFTCCLSDNPHRMTEKLGLGDGQNP